MSKSSKTYVITRIDQFLYLVGLGAAGLLNLVFDMQFFLNFKLFFLVAVAFTLVRDWNQSWVTFTTSDEGEALGREGQDEVASSELR